mgnify:CR=1 FL=1
MRILIDIGHPAHIHLFKNFAWDMERKGHDIFFTCREKEFEIYLLKQYGFDYKSFGAKYSSMTGKVWGLFDFGIKEVIAGLKIKPDIFLSHGSIYAAHAASLLHKPHISLEDTYNLEQIRLYKPFTKCILTADCDHPLKAEKIIRYAGYHELSYLHPKRFTPDKNVLKELARDENFNYIIMRFVSWNASHDIGHSGISYDNKIRAVKEFSQLAKVYITSEVNLPRELKEFQFSLSPEKMHDAIAGASLVFGESATMVSEASVLGVPSIYIDDTGRLYTREQEEKYGLCFNYSESLDDQEKAIQKGIDILEKENILEDWQRKRKRMLNEKIDVTAFLVWFIENWPHSFKIMKENPDYQYRFK